MSAGSPIEEAKTLRVQLAGDAAAAPRAGDAEEAREAAAGLRQPVEQRAANNLTLSFGDDQKVAARAGGTFEHARNVARRDQRLGREVGGVLHAAECGD